MASEETPLLTSERRQNVVDSEHQTSTYDQFSPRKKAMILAMVSFCGLLPRTFVTFPASWMPLSGVTVVLIYMITVLIPGSFVPLIPQIARDLDSTGSIVR
jgi:hypothetical protein